MSRVLFTALALVTATSCAQAESGMASFYDGIGPAGEMTCAHRTRPMGSMVKVSYKGHTIRCRVNDRGPFIKKRIIDVSISAARALGMMDAGVVQVVLEDDEPIAVPTQAASKQEVSKADNSKPDEKPASPSTEISLIGK